MANRLAAESSPYLLQHKDNPVDWYPWGEEALAHAREADKPILLSIGYSACHWCHVMEHESFEDEATAALMNERYVNIKVDREERPDLDSIYMDAVTAMTGQGGWPMTVFLTPDGVPFYGGTYYPPTPRYGMPSFSQVLQSVSDAYRSQRDQVVAQGQKLLDFIAQRTRLEAGDEELGGAILEAAFEKLARSFDARWGGFSASGPKFPQPMVLEFVVRYLRRHDDPRGRRIVETTLTRMARGGMYDQLGGGFARYSVDEKWLVPHFEKMLYDNGQLITLYLHAYQLTGNPLYRQVVEETIGYLEREMTDPGGAFFSSQDADSEGEEGRFFVWSVAEIDTLLTPEQARVLKAYYNVRPGGNFEGKTILWVPEEPTTVAANLNLDPRRMTEILDAARGRLFAARAERVAPATDTKVLTSWNALAIGALAEASQILAEPRYLAAAQRAATFLVTRMRDDEGRLLRTWRATTDTAKLDAYLEDYAYLVDALARLYEADADPTWLETARELADRMLDEFSDPRGGFFDTGESHERLVVRPKDVVDNATPSGNAMAATALLRLAAYLGEPRYEEAAREALQLVGVAMGEQPLGFGQWLVALDWAIEPTTEFALIGAPEEVAPFRERIYAHFLPNKIVAEAPDELTAAERAALLPLLTGRERVGGEPTAYLCVNLACRLPVTDASALAEQIEHQL